MTSNAETLALKARAVRAVAVKALVRTGVSFTVALLLASTAAAQVVDTTKPPVRVVRPDSAAVVPQPLPGTRPQLPRSMNVAQTTLRKPPITTKRAFLYSLLVPGLGQSRLDRGTAGALFAAIELGSLAMLRKTTVDLRQARQYSGDSLPNNYTVGADGKITGTGAFPSPYPTDLVSTRRLHSEDWLAALAFNHLLSGLDAYVAAQLWDIPTSVAVRPHANGVALVATVRW